MVGAILATIVLPKRVDVTSRQVVGCKIQAVTLTDEIIIIN